MNAILERATYKKWLLTIKRISDKITPPSLACLYKSDLDLNRAGGVIAGLWDDIAFEWVKNERVLSISIGQLSRWELSE